MLLRILGEPGNVLRVRLKKNKRLKLATETFIGKAYEEPEKKRMFEAADASRSPAIFMALMLAQSGGMRDSEIKTLQFPQINLMKRFIKVGIRKDSSGYWAHRSPEYRLVRSSGGLPAWYIARFGPPA